MRFRSTATAGRMKSRRWLSFSAAPPPATSMARRWRWTAASTPRASACQACGYDSRMIDSKEALRSLYPAAKERSVRKQLDHLDRHCLRFVALSPFVVLASGDRAGMLDASPRGGEPGFVKAPDATTLLIPDAPGNNRLDTLENILAAGRLGLLFLI